MYEYGYRLPDIAEELLSQQVLFPSNTHLLTDTMLTKMWNL